MAHACCSFCQGNQDKRIASGPGAIFICEECVETYAQIFGITSAKTDALQNTGRTEIDEIESANLLTMEKVRLLSKESDTLSGFLELFRGALNHARIELIEAHLAKTREQMASSENSIAQRAVDLEIAKTELQSLQKKLKRIDAILGK